LDLSQFEFISIAFSIVLGLAIARLLEGLRDSFDPRRRYWIHAAWVFGKLVNALIIFWGWWTLRDALEGFNFAIFSLSLGPPAIIFLQVHTLLTAHPDQITNWRERFWQVRRWFFGANLLLPIYNLLGLYVFSGRPFPSPEVAPLIGIFLISLVGFVSSSERVHSALVVFYLVALGLGVGGIFVTQG
jgi:hypothetical protein